MAKPRLRLTDAKVAQTLVIEGDTVKAMYTEVGVIDVREFGTIELAKKVSDVEFNAEMQRWEAKDRKTRRVVAHDPLRSECVRKEHAYYENRIRLGKYPW